MEWDEGDIEGWIWGVAGGTGHEDKGKGEVR